MLLSRLVAPVLLLAVPAIPVLSVTPAQAASFDCAVAKTPLEHAICDFADLSKADELLAKTYATAVGGLTKGAVIALRADQKNWLDYAQRACNDDAEPKRSGSYDDTGATCLVSIFNARSTALEQSRMLGGHRFYLQSVYGALPDPNEADNPDSSWKIATHELTYPVLDSDDPLAKVFNDYMSARVDGLSQTSTDAEGSDAQDGSSDTSVTVNLKQVVGVNRLTFDTTTYWYGHGAAHGNYTLSYFNYYVPKGREVIAEDMFAGDDWASTLVDAAWEQLQAQHKEWLQVESASDIAEMVVEPTRWDLGDDYGLTIQFQPYEVAAYAYGAPTITIPWEKLDAIKAESQDSVRFGY